MKVLFLYDSLRLGGGEWNRSRIICSALERHHRVSYAYQVVQQKSWNKTKDQRLRDELMGSAQFADGGFDCLIVDGRTHEDPAFPRVPPEVLRDFSRSGGATIFLFEDLRRLLDGSMGAEHITELTSATGLIHTLFVHPGGSIVRGYPAGGGGPINLSIDEAYLGRLDGRVRPCYRNVRSLLVSNPIYLPPVFDALCSGDRNMLWVTGDDELVDTMRSLPPAFSSMLRADALTVFMTGDLWRDYLAERSPDNVAFIESLVRFAEDYQRERKRTPPRPGVFISYSHADKDLARAFTQELERRGAEVWLDEKAMGLGASISESCEAGIRRSEKVVLLISTESLRSDWVRFELETAVAVGEETGRRDSIVPVVLGLDPTEVAAALPAIRDIKYLNLSASATDIDDHTIASILG